MLRPTDRAVGDASGRVLIATEGTLSENFAQPARPGLAPRLPLGDGSSVVDCLDAKLLEALEVVLHRLKDIGGVPLPVCEFPRDQSRVTRAVRVRRVAGELLVRQVRVVLDGASWFHDVDPARAFADCQFCSPDSGVHCGRQIDVVGLLAAAEVGVVAGLDQIFRLQFGTCAVVVALLASVAHALMVPREGLAASANSDGGLCDCPTRAGRGQATVANTDRKS